MDLILANEGPLKTWAVDLAGNVAACGIGLAFMDDQITERRSDAKRAWEKLREPCELLAKGHGSMDAT